LLRYRDKDGDGLLEWGGHAILECVRDSYVAIWEEMGNDPAAPKRLEALDLSCMAVMEMKSLVKMAQELGMTDQAEFWQKKANHMAELINKHMWDSWDGFYYNIDRQTNRFSTSDGINLKRMEIIGFLPMWAGIVSERQAESLTAHLTNTDKFWRRFGVPTLAADDPYYDPFVKKCCMWNGPVWLLWDYMVMHGLLNYDRVDIAKELVDKVFNAVAFQLSNNHRFWESFSPDYTKLQSPKSYIWDCIIARMFIDLHEAEKRASK
jgi:glycogen debranching enzyme